MTEEELQPITEAMQMALDNARELLGATTVGMAIVIVHSDDDELMNLSVHVAGNLRAVSEALTEIAEDFAAQRPVMEQAKRRATQ